MGTGVFFSLPYHGHINPCIPVIAELARRGEHIIAYTTDEFRLILNEAGAEFRQFAYTPSNISTLTHMAHWQLRVTSSTMTRLTGEVRASRANYVLADASCLWGFALSQHLRLPAVALYSSLPMALQRISDLRCMAFELFSAPNSFLTVLRFLVLDARLARSWGIPRLASPMTLVRRRDALEHLVLVHSSLQHDLNDNTYHFVGPCVRTRDCTRGEALPAEDGRPLVYVSLGTVWNNRSDFFQLCVEAYRDCPYEILLSVGSSLDLASLTAVPPNIHIRRHVDQIAVLARAAAFVSHSGMSSLSEALFAGVPLVLYPQAIDQFPLAELMEAHGVAILLKQDRLTPHALRQATDRALHDAAILARCHELRDRIRRSGNGAHRAADLVFAALHRYKQGHGPGDLRDGN